MTPDCATGQPCRFAFRSRATELWLITLVTNPHRTRHVRYAGEPGAGEGVFGYGDLALFAQRVADGVSTWLDDDPIQ
jgi:hypothetical protein